MLLSRNRRSSSGISGCTAGNCSGGASAGPALMISYHSSSMIRLLLFYQIVPAGDDHYVVPWAHLEVLLKRLALRVTGIAVVQQAQDTLFKHPHPLWTWFL